MVLAMRTGVLALATTETSSFSQSNDRARTLFGGSCELISLLETSNQPTALSFGLLDRHYSSNCLTSVLLPTSTRTRVSLHLLLATQLPSCFFRLTNHIKRPRRMFGLRVWCAETCVLRLFFTRMQRSNLWGCGRQRLRTGCQERM